LFYLLECLGFRWQGEAARVSNEPGAPLP
jgi:hypothetical protein